MRLWTLIFCLALAACGGGRDRAEPREGRLAGIGNYLTNAFAASPEEGGLCGDPMLVGREVGPIEGRLNGCGIEKAVRLRAVGDVRLSQEALIECATARSLKRWLDSSAIPAIGRRGGGLNELRVAAHYSCRTRNSQPGAEISEHGRGRAIDISGFHLRDGSVITVLDGWGRGREGRILSRMHDDACGPFGTVLGPESDRFHRDHFHFDTMRHRSGPYCR